MVPHANDGHVDLSGPVPRRPSKKSGRKKKREPASRRGAKPRVVLDGSQQLGTPGPQNLIVDIATFTHSKPAGEKWVPHLNGPNQGGFATSAITQEMLKQMKGRLAGQDYAMTLHPIPGDISQTLCLILDGHGEFGELFAVYGGEALAAKYEEKWGELRQLCITGDFCTNGGADIIRSAFNEVDALLRTTLGAFRGGATATVVAIIDGEWMVSANVGDSPAILAQDNGSYEVLTASHSADNPEEYNRYRHKCKAEGTTPAEFVYNRFNCSSGPQIPGPNGDNKPIPIFEYDEAGDVRTIPRNAEYVNSLGYHGGIQSVRKHVVTDTTGTAIATDPKHIHENWGSTVAGRPQFTRMLGDFEDKDELHLDCEPGLHVTRLYRSRTSTLLVASDGIMDAHWFGILAERLKARADAGENTARGLCQAMVQDTIVNAKEANFAFKEDEATGRDVPAWDDLSATLIVLPAVFQPVLAGGCGQSAEGITRVDGMPAHMVR